MVEIPGFDWQGLASVLVDTLPSPLFVFDQNVRLQAYNRAAGSLLSRPASLVLNHRCGRVLGCINHSMVEGGCGTSQACNDCLLRLAVMRAIGGKKVFRKKTRLQLLNDDDSYEDIHLLITSAPFEHQERKLALVVLEDISELTELKSIIPICSYCKRIRTDEEYWSEVEEFLRQHLDADLSHGICPECYQNAKKELELGLDEN